MTNKDCSGHVPIGNIVLHWLLIKRHPSSLFCCSFFSLSDLFGIKLVSFLSSPSWQGSWYLLPLWEETIVESFLQESFHNFSFTYAFPGSSLLCFIILRFLPGNNNIAWRCPKKPLIGWSGIICHHPDQGQSWMTAIITGSLTEDSSAILKLEMMYFLHHSSTF